MALSSQFWVLLLVKMSFLLWGSSYHLECSLSKYVFYVSPHRNSTQPPFSNTTFVSKSFLFILAVSSFSIFWMIKYFISSFWRVFHIDSIKKKLGEKNDRTMQTCFMMNSFAFYVALFIHSASNIITSPQSRPLSSYKHSSSYKYSKTQLERR